MQLATITGDDLFIESQVMCRGFTSSWYAGRYPNTWCNMGRITSKVRYVAYGSTRRPTEDLGLRSEDMYIH